MLININQDVLSTLSKTELEVIQFINANVEQLPTLSIVDIAYETYSSPATVSRAIRKCGINGFNELRYKTTAKTKDNEVHHVGEIMNKSLIEVQRLLEQISISDILNVIEIFKQSSRIYVLGRGLSEFVGEEFTFKLQLLGFDAVFIHDPNIMKIKSQHLKKSECLFSFSLNGKTEEIIEACKNAKLGGAKVISCYCNGESKLSELSDYSLIGFQHPHVAISTYEVSSRVSLSMVARIIIDYIASDIEGEKSFSV